MIEQFSLPDEKELFKYLTQMSDKEKDGLLQEVEAELAKPDLNEDYIEQLNIIKRALQKER